MKSESVSYGERVFSSSLHCWCCQTYLNRINQLFKQHASEKCALQTDEKQRNGSVADHDGFGSLMVSIVFDKLPVLITAMSWCEHVTWHNEL